MRRIVLLTALVFGIALTGYGLAQPAGGKNLKVLPKTLSKPDIKKYMKSVADALGVQCDHCHDTDDMAKDTPKKDKAREMILMTQNLNKTSFKGKDRVKCVTCHNGKKEPK
jgi:hypothetical protein